MNPDDQRTSCPGFLDSIGVWNNGFECPPLAGQIQICCESDSHRYCCTVENFHKTSSSSSNLLNSYATSETSLLFNDRKSSSLLTLPILLICILITIIVFLLIFISICFWSRHRNQKNRRKHQEKHATKTTLLVDHFPFSPPHHQFFLHDYHSRLNNKSPLSHQQTRDTLTTTTIAPSSTASSSSTSGRIPSDIYFNDWKDFLIAADQPMNIYPSMSSHSIELNNDQPYHFYHGKRQPNDDMV
ncbi:hypothetical protein I4U23_006727 [Adineta vaga]|nr:hypothetical protein I4U23_006727 [Adineta vaga]